MNNMTLLLFSGSEGHQERPSADAAKGKPGRNTLGASALPGLQWAQHHHHQYPGSAATSHDRQAR